LASGGGETSSKNGRLSLKEAPSKLRISPGAEPALARRVVFDRVAGGAAAVGVGRGARPASRRSRAESPWRTARPTRAVPEPAEAEEAKTGERAKTNAAATPTSVDNRREIPGTDLMRRSLLLRFDAGRKDRGRRNCRRFLRC
jgi:hypothetical protein